MIDLNDASSIEAADPGSVALSVSKFPEQISQAWREARALQFPEEYSEVKNILIDGMGGSSLGPELISYLFSDQIELPLTVLHDYNLPAFANEETLVIISSYSGTTEEPLEFARQAQAKGCKLTAITEGRDLGSFLEENKLPGYVFKADHNPSKQPRLGLGYSIAGILGMLEAIGLLKVPETQVDEVETYLQKINGNFQTETLTSENKAKSLAVSLQDSQIAIIAGEFLRGNAHIFANQLNENAKNFANYFFLSELNHHLLEGLANPKDLKKEMKFIFLDSKFYSAQIAKRLKITNQVLEKQGFKTFQFQLGGPSKLVQAFEAILVSSWTSFYLGLLNGVDPAKIPWVDFFKEELAKP